MQVSFSEDAISDLHDIRAYIGQENPFAASRVAVQLIAACDSLEHMAERGRPGLVPGTREITTVWPYIIIYRIKADEVEVLRIWHGARDR